MKIRVVLEYDEKYKGYVVSVPGVPGCFTQGQSLEEALSMAQEAIELMLDEPAPKHLKKHDKIFTFIFDKPKIVEVKKKGKDKDG